MAIPPELFRVWVECDVTEFVGGPSIYTWVNVWHVLYPDPLADPSDVASVWAAHVNQGAAAGRISSANVVTKYGGRNVLAGGADTVVVTGNVAIGAPNSLLPPQCAVLVLGGTFSPRHQTRKWIGAGLQNWIETTTGKVDSSDAVRNAYWRGFLTDKLLAGSNVIPIVWDAFREEYHEIQFTSIMKGFRTQRRRSLAEEGQFT